MFPVARLIGLLAWGHVGQVSLGAAAGAHVVLGKLQIERKVKGPHASQFHPFGTEFGPGVKLTTTELLQLLPDCAFAGSSQAQYNTTQLRRIVKALFMTTSINEQN